MTENAATPTSSDVERLVRGFFDKAINTGDLAVFDKYCAPDYVWHGGADPGGLGDVHGLDAFKRAVAMFFTGFPDLKVEILDMLVDGDRAAVRFGRLEPISARSSVSRRRVTL